MSTLLPEITLTEGPNVTYWKPTQQGFTTKSFVGLMSSPISEDLSINFDHCWSSLVPPRVQFFIWVFLHSGIPTKSFLVHKNIILDSQQFCLVCDQIERQDHLFLHCPLAYQVILWEIWKAWNKSVFQQHQPALAEDLIFHSFYLAGCYTKCKLKDFVLLGLDII